VIGGAAAHALALFRGEENKEYICLFFPQAIKSIHCNRRDSDAWGVAGLGTARGRGGEVERGQKNNFEGMTKKQKKEMPMDKMFYIIDFKLFVESPPLSNASPHSYSPEMLWGNDPYQPIGCGWSMMCVRVCARVCSLLFFHSSA